MLAEWSDKPAGALYLLPLWNPVLLAEQVATLACIAQGRFILQCGLGGDRRQSLGMGVDPKLRTGMFETSLAALRALWRGEEVSLDRYWSIERARIAPLPPEPIEVWVGAQAPAAIHRAARVAEGWLASPSLTPQQAADGINRYWQACAEHARTPSATAIRRDIFIGATSAEARRVVEPYLAAGYRGFPPEAIAYGSVAEVAEQFLHLGEIGFTDIIVRNLSARQDECLATIERLGAVRALLT
jgi:alkanesulfonate monooxygenase SsuD/methylene tetrahydromethanopterin reductase-like flavin-dependent oxidoreductase (luciferase family)